MSLIRTKNRQIIPSMPAFLQDYLRWQYNIPNPTIPLPEEDHNIIVFTEEIQGKTFCGIEQLFLFAPETNPLLQDFVLVARVLFRPHLTRTGLSHWDPEERVKLEMALRRKAQPNAREGVINCIHLVIADLPVTENMAAQTDEELRRIQEEVERLQTTGELEGTPLKYRSITATTNGGATLTPVGAFFALRSWVAGHTEYNLGDLIYNPAQTPPLGLGWNAAMKSQMRHAFMVVGAEEQYVETIYSRLLVLAKSHPEWFWQQDDAGLLPVVQDLFHGFSPPQELLNLVPLSASGPLAIECLYAKIFQELFSIEEICDLLCTTHAACLQKLILTLYADRLEPILRPAVQETLLHHLCPDALVLFVKLPWWSRKTRNRFKHYALKKVTRILRMPNLKRDETKIILKAYTQLITL